jgi:L-erythro-3,5-diaminohexanoate dehydrogenase
VDPYGLRRVVSPAGVLPQRADRLDPDLPLGDDELSLDVDALNIDSASFKQISDEVGRDAARIGEEVGRIVRERGKMHNPVTGSGGMLIGRVRAVGPRHPAADELAPGDRIATLVSLTLTPLRIDEVLAVHPEVERIDVRGSAVLFATGLWSRLPSDMPDKLALAALDVCGAPALVARHARPGARVLVIGAGKSGALVCAQAKETLAGSGEVVAADLNEKALADLTAIGVVDRTLHLDATLGVDALHRVESAGGLFDLVVNCANVPGTELSTLLLVRDGGTVIFFSMATSFTAAALGAEGVGKDATLLIGNGYVPGHAGLALGLLRRNSRLRAHFEARYLR